MESRFNLWIEQDGVVVLSPWRLRLLEAIDAAGSISAAAEVLNIPYRRAWEKLQEMEQGLGFKLVDTAVGGAGGGGAHLTEAARDAMRRFRLFADGFDQVVAARYEAAFRAPGPASPPPTGSSASER